MECNVNNICIRDIDCVGRWVQGDYLCNAATCGTGTREEKFEVITPKEGAGHACEAMHDARRYVACDHPSGPCPTSTATWKDVSITWWNQNNWSDFTDGSPEWWRTGYQTQSDCKNGCEANNNGSVDTGNLEKYTNCIAYRWDPNSEKKCYFSNNLPPASIAKAANEDTIVGPGMGDKVIQVNLTPDNQLGYGAY
jgi:hypothetical protein